MNSIVGRFRKEEIDGKQYFVYHLDSIGESSMASDNTPTLFLCPDVRFKPFRQRYVDLDDELEFHSMEYREIDSSPYLIGENESSDDNNERKRLDLDNHHDLLLLSGFKKNEDDEHVHNNCKICQQGLKIGTDYYFCVTCDDVYHKECVESPPEIKHPHHPNHPLKLVSVTKDDSCVYRCTLCNVSMENVCAFKPIPLVLEKTKRHDHPLTFFTRKDHLRCNVCSLINNNHSTYVCLECDYVVHQDCADFPSVIRICRHHHRISFTSFLQPGKRSCGVCRKDVDSEYGAYTCNKCDDYVVHSRCALRKDIWDEKELEGIPEEDDIEKVLDPFERKNDGSILHFLHKHVLKPVTSGEIYDERKICHACVLPIYEGKFYSCMDCDFILHDSCANAPRKIRHPLHPFPLTLKKTSEYNDNGLFLCFSCFRYSSGFIYECNERNNFFRLDIRCGSISEPFVYQGHEHPLFLALDPEEKHLCRVCERDNRILINCIECDFIICLKCVTLPYMVRYKHDNHFLTLVHEKETKEPDWCEVCERLLILLVEDEEYDDDKRFYECKQCCTTLHIKCLLGKSPYLKPGHTVIGDIQIVANSSLSRPYCGHCGHRCVDKIFFKRSNDISCVLDHVSRY